MDAPMKECKLKLELMDWDSVTGAEPGIEGDDSDEHRSRKWRVGQGPNRLQLVTCWRVLIYYYIV